MLELVVQVSLREAEPIRKSWLEDVLVGALQHSSEYFGMMYNSMKSVVEIFFAYLGSLHEVLFYR